MIRGIHGALRRVYNRKMCILKKKKVSLISCYFFSQECECRGVPAVNIVREAVNVLMYTISMLQVELDL